MEPRTGVSLNPISPAPPDVPEEADVADVGEAAEVKAGQVEQGEGKYGSQSEKQHNPNEAREDDEGKKSSWIEIELIGMDDKPIPGEAYRIVLPDGETVAEGTLDENGKARIEGLEPGECKVSFQNRDKEAWEKA
ncbi:MAG: hypothetical protein KJ645_01095 [Planctomycetes bacterium]|nr:hypothetical protein [Planctomycetota bacterium]